MRLIIKNSYNDCARWTADYIADKIIKDMADVYIIYQPKNELKPSSTKCRF